MAGAGAVAGACAAAGAGAVAAAVVVAGAGVVGPAGPDPRPGAGHGRQDAPRQEQHHRAQQAAEQQQPDGPGVGAAQAGAGEVGQRLEDEGPQHRAPQGAAPAQQGGQHDQHAGDDVEHGGHVQERHVVGVQAARDADERPAEHERDHLVDIGPQAEPGRLVLVVGDREQAEAELAPADHGGYRDGQDQEAEQRVVERPVLVRQAPRGQRQGQALAAAGQPGPGGRDDADQLQRGERDDDEVHAAGAPGDQAQDGGGQRADQAAGQAAGERREVRPDGQDAGRVRAKPDEEAVAEGDVARVAAHDVPAGGPDPEQERHDEQVLDVEVARDQREGGQDDHGHGDDRAPHGGGAHVAASGRAARVNSPCGRISSTTRMRSVGTAADQRTEM